MIAVGVRDIYILLRNSTPDWDRDGRILLCVSDIRDAIWDVLTEQEEKEKAREARKGHES
jgi:hypothetical protein